MTVAGAAAFDIVIAVLCAVALGYVVLIGILLWHCHSARKATWKRAEGERREALDLERYAPKGAAVSHSLYQLPLHKRLVLRLIERIEKWVFKRKWVWREQVYHAFQLTKEDKEWLGHDKKMRAVCTRHCIALTDYWHTTSFRRIGDFRDELGLNPYRKEQ